MEDEKGLERPESLKYLLNQTAPLFQQSSNSGLENVPEARFEFPERGGHLTFPTFQLLQSSLNHIKCK